MHSLDPVAFPHGHVETAGVTGASLVTVAGITGSPTAGGGGLLVALVFSLMVAASAGSARTAASPDEHRPSGFDFRGLRHLGRGPLLRVIATLVVLIVATTFVSAITGAWWVGLGAAPLAARTCMAYARRWRPVELQPSEARDSSRP